MAGVFSVVCLTAETTSLYNMQAGNITKDHYSSRNQFCILHYRKLFIIFCVIMKYNNEKNNKVFKVRESTGIRML